MTWVLCLYLAFIYIGSWNSKYARRSRRGSYRRPTRNK